MNRDTSKCLLLALVCIVGVGVGGCRDVMPHALTWPAGGDVVPSHAKPPEGGYYSNWDPYAGTLEVIPVTDTNPVGTQHVLIATVLDHEGNPLPNRRVEWIIPEGGSVGGLVEVDESGLRASRGYKLTNSLAVSHTNNYDHVLTRGNDDPSDDIQLTRGQTWAVITSVEEGTTHVIAYAPGIYNWDKHKVFVKKHWYDVDYEWPPAATNPMGTDHVLATKVMKYTDKTPLAGYEVRYAIVSGPDAVLVPGERATANVTTDKDGIARVTLRQARPAKGVNRIEITVIRPGNEKCCKEPVTLATGETTKTWIGPDIAIAKSAAQRARVGEEFAYNITVTNPSGVDVTNATLSDVLPDGIAHVSSNPEARVDGQKLTWSLGTIRAGGSVKGTITVRAARTGTFENCATVAADHGLRARACATTVVTQPKLALTKTGPQEVIQCESIQYVLEVANPGDAPATNVRVIDQLPEGLTWKGERAVRFDVGTIEPGQSQTMRYQANASRTGEFENTAVASADDGLEARASHKVTVRKPQLVLAKTGPRFQYVGRNVTWTLAISNKGDAEARDTVLVDTLPAGAKFISASDGGKRSGGKVTWNLGTLAVNASRQVSVTLSGDRMGTLTNRASATAFCAEADAEASTTIRGIPAILLEMIDVADPIEIGANETYVITITNQGSAADSEIVIQCTIPDQQDYVSAVGPTKPSVKGNVVTFGALDSLAPKAKAVYKITVKAAREGDVRFRVKMTTSQTGEVPVEETEATRIYSTE